MAASPVADHVEVVAAVAGYATGNLHIPGAGCELCMDIGESWGNGDTCIILYRSTYVFYFYFYGYYVSDIWIVICL